MKVCFVQGSLSRLAGGLQHSVRGIARGLRASGADVSVMAFSDEWSEADSALWENAGVVVRLVPRQGGGVWPIGSMKKALRSVQPNCVHINGLWGLESLAVQSWSRETGGPYIVSPRGMLDPWALKQRRFRKVLFLKLFLRAHLRSARFVHALTEAEVAQVLRVEPRSSVKCIPNGMLFAGDPPTHNPRVGEPKVLLFLGRIHEKKAVLELVEGWGLACAESQELAERWVLRIAGWGESGYVTQVKDAIRRSPGLIDFLGPVHGDAKAKHLAGSSAFILASRSEGLPMAVLEAWSFALPVLITEECNLSGAFGFEAACRIESSPQRMAKQLKDHLLAPGLSQIGRNGFRYGADNFHWPDLVARYWDMYEMAARSVLSSEV